MLIALLSLWQQLISLFPQHLQGPMWMRSWAPAGKCWGKWKQGVISSRAGVGEGEGAPFASFLRTSGPVVLERQNQLVEQPVSLCQHHRCPSPKSLQHTPATYPTEGGVRGVSVRPPSNPSLLPKITAQFTGKSRWLERGETEREWVAQRRRCYMQ